MPSTRSYIFFGLNGVRVLSIVALILVFASSILVMVTNIKAVNNFQAIKATSNGTTTEAEEYMLDCDYIKGSTVPNQAAGVFWAVVSSLLVLFQSVILILSEVGWPAAFFERFFPVLGPNFGLGALGIFQCLIGAQILSHHVDDFTLVAAFFLFSLGCLNMVLGLIFRESAKEKRSIRAWKDTKPLLPISKPSHPIFENVPPPASLSHADINSTMRSFNSQSSFSNEKASFGFGRQGEKAAGLHGYVIPRPEESLPRYTSPSPPPSVRAPRPLTPPQSPPKQFRPLSDATTDPAPSNKIHRMKSTTSSFASPGARVNRYSARTEDMYLDEEDRESVSVYSTHETPIPTFRSSPTAF